MVQNGYILNVSTEKLPEFLKKVREDPERDCSGRSAISCCKISGTALRHEIC